LTESQRKMACPEKEKSTNVTANKMAAVAKLTEEKEDGADALAAAEKHHVKG